MGKIYVNKHGIGSTHFRNLLQKKKIFFFKDKLFRKKNGTYNIIHIDAKNLAFFKSLT